MKKPNLSFWQIWNLSFGFLGVQIGYSLQNSNTSRIFQSMGADLDQLTYFWLAAPLAGLVIQPIVGLFSDSTWTRFGRRIPFILGGAIVSTIALFLMPNAHMFAFAPLLMGAIVLLFMDMSFNVTMQPFRALVGDMLNDNQKTKGYVVQTFLINVGAIVGAFLPWVFKNWFDVSNQTTVDHPVADNVAWAYYIGGAVLLVTVLVTSFMTREYPPEEFSKYNPEPEADEKHIGRPSFLELLRNIPRVMLQLGVVQFFSWAALFLMWNFLTAAVADNVWGTLDAQSDAFNEAGDWVGILNGVYSLFACIFSFCITPIVARVGLKGTYSLSLLAGAAGFGGLCLITDAYWLLVPMIGIGIAWAGILAMPYSILSRGVKAERMGVYMGIFNFTITIPQIFIGLTGGVLIKYLLDGRPVLMMAVAGLFMLLAAASVGLVNEKHTGE